MKTKSIFGHLARLLLGLVFIFSGFVKAVDPLGTTYKIEDYLKAFGGFFTDLMPLAQPAAIALIAIEILLGICLVTNVKTQWTSWITLLFYLVMTPLTLYIALTNPVSDCGCFGDALVLTNWQTFYKNVVLLILAIALLICRKAVYPTFVWQVEWGIILLSILLAGGFMFYNLSHLPVVDFRPYKVGNNIPELMEFPEDAEPDQYEISFIYEKEGVEQEFDLTNYPKNDSTWTFVRQNSRLIKKGYEPPIHDFEILTMDYEDITFDILESETPVTLVVMYDLSKTERKVLDQVTDLYHNCLSRQESFYILTGAGEDDIMTFCYDVEKDNTSNRLTPFNHPEAVFCTCDPVTLKTIVRANPGAIVVKDGIIIDKFRF